MNRNTGFTLIEVLVAVVVLAVGLLGLAGMQVNSLGNNQSAYNRSQATQLAYDLSDRMRSNRAGIATYSTIQPAAATYKANCKNATGCNPASMAENDLFEWNRDVGNTLPGGTAAIAVAGNVFTITVTWADEKDGSNLNFQTSFQL